MARGSATWPTSAAARRAESEAALPPPRPPTCPRSVSDQIEHRLGRHAATGKLVLPNLDLEHRLPRKLLDGHVGAAADRFFEHSRDFGRLRVEHVEVVAVELHGHGRFHARHHFIESHLNRLREREPLAGKLPYCFVLDQLGQASACDAAFLPRRAGRQRDEHVGQLDAHRIGGYVGHADATPNVGHFVGELATDGAFHLGVVAHRFVKIGARQADDVDRHGPLGKLRHELGPQLRRDDAKCQPQQRRREGQHRKPVMQREPQHGSVEPFDQPHH